MFTFYLRTIAFELTYDNCRDNTGHEFEDTKF